MTPDGDDEPDQDPGARERLEAVRRGDATAIDGWYRSEHPQVYRLCLGFLADAHDADDLAQDAMLRLLDRLDAWNPHRPWRQWRNTVVLNLCRDRLRRAGARRRAEAEAALIAIPGALPAPHEQLEASELRAALADTLRHLSPREREAFEDTADVAATLGVTPATVRSLLTLARRRLRTLLGPQLSAHGLAPESSP